MTRLIRFATAKKAWAKKAWARQAWLNLGWAVWLPILVGTSVSAHATDTARHAFKICNQTSLRVLVAYGEDEDADAVNSPERVEGWFAVPAHGCTGFGQRRTDVRVYAEARDGNRTIVFAPALTTPKDYQLNFCVSRHPFTFAGGRETNCPDAEKRIFHIYNLIDQTATWTINGYP